jgi:VWFA-related protein
MMHRAGAVIAFTAAALAAPAAWQQQPQFRTGVDVVQLNVAVTDKTRVISDLVAADFEVLDNGVRQEVVSISREALPIDVTMALDTSESVVQWVQNAIVSAANRIRERLKPEDRLSLVTFNQRIHERIALLPASEASAISLGRPTGQTSVNDVVASVLAARAVVDRRQLAIVFSDGYDTTSLLDEDDVIEMARRSQTAMFFVSGQQGGARRVVRTWSATTNGGLALTTTLGPEEGNRNPLAFFHRVAAATGGVVQVTQLSNITVSMGGRVVVRPQTNLLDEPFIKALDDFRTSYVLNYQLAGVPRPGWHEVTVRVKRPGTKYTVRTRNGYTGG